MLILGIETSCDETAAAVVKDGNQTLSNLVSSQVKLHAPHGGVVPELASRAHIEKIIPVIDQAIRKARIKPRDLDCIAVTCGPGLIPALMIGVDTARALSFAWQKPIIGVNHILGHIFSIKIGNKAQKVKESFFPAVCLTVSGGHTKLILIQSWENYKVIGETLDDACGEAFDKVAKLLDLGYPGGPIVERMAKQGDCKAFNFPRPILHQANFDFSFSGLKTAVLYQVRKIDKKKLNKYDICASFQAAAFDVLIIKTLKASRKYKIKSVILTGGVAANKALQNLFRRSLATAGYKLLITKFPTDNAAMIAAAAYPRAIKKDYDDWRSLQANANLKLKS